jgi:hypothetical protein
MLEQLGRFHLVALHLPIGFLLLAFLMEMAARRSAPALRPAVGFTLFWGMVSAVAAAGLGYLLSLNGNYDDDLLSWHKWLGFATAGLSVALYFFHQKKASSKFYLPLFGLTVLTLTLAGHFGGTLTHGSGFLFENKKTDSAEAAPIANLDSARVFADVVLPVLKNKCGGCHNPSKRKGELVILTKEDILKGGENGPAILMDNLSESPLLKGIQLPLEDEYHMPPKGKKQLTEQEKQLLEWWINSGAPFEKTVAECSMPEAVYASLSARAQQKASPLAALKLDPVSAAKLNDLREQGIAVYALAEGSPFLQVSFSGKKDLSNAVLKNLKKVGENIVQLDFAGSNLDDAMLAVVKDLPHLNRLHLERTYVTDAGLANLTQLKFLEYLNLYQTKVTDAGLDQLKSLPNLKSVYLWQTAVTEQGIAKFASLKPEIFINKGVENDSMFGEVGLKPPVFKTTKELFMDTVAVELEAGFGHAEIRYTTDGTDPDSTSKIYQSPILLEASTEVKVKAFKEGWTSSGIASRQFVKVRYKPKDISLARQPDKRYAGQGPKTLIDFKKGGPSFRNGDWLGFQGEHCVATLDLGEMSDVSRVTVGGIEDTGSWLFFPKGLRISVSSDGKNFKKVKEAAYPVAADQTQPSNKIFSEGFPETQARYVKVEVLSVLKNPKWHPNAGQPCWVFVDEILVE